MPTRADSRLARRGGGVELLRLPAALYGIFLHVRRALYDRRWLPIVRLDAPVVSVGNLSAGGTGKSPMVAWLARELVRRGLRPGVVSRGYGAHAPGTENDEALALREELPELLQAQDPDRGRGARALLVQGADALILDDGFQHRRLHRDLDLVLIDVTRPWGLPSVPPGGEALCALLPRGLLREPPRALARAGLIVLTRTDQAPASAREALLARVEELAPGAPVACTVHCPRALRAVHAPRERAAVEILRGARVELVSGIGNPDAFESSVRALGAEVLAHRRFPDHHAYLPSDVEGLGAAGARLLTTTKDAVKLRALPPPRGSEPWALEVELALVEGAAVLAALLDALPRSRARAERMALHGGLAG